MVVAALARLNDEVAAVALDRNLSTEGRAAKVQPFKDTAISVLEAR